MSVKFPNAHFLNVDVDACQETAASYGVTAMPTFVFLRNKTRLALLKGADKAGLEAKIQQFYTDASQDSEVGVKGMVRWFLWFPKPRRLQKNYLMHIRQDAEPLIRPQYDMYFPGVSKLLICDFVN